MFVNKSDYFFDRLVRNLPIPIPGDGQQLLSLTCSEDVASILTSPLNHLDAALEQRYFNCGTNQLITYNEVAYSCAEVVGIAKEDVQIEYFDSEFLGTKGTFPFRMTDFFVKPDLVQEKLGWKGSQHTFMEDLPAYYKDYIDRGGPTKKLSLVKDWEIVVGCKTSPPDKMGSIYDQYDPIPFENYVKE